MKRSQNAVLIAALLIYPGISSANIEDAQNQAAKILQEGMKPLTGVGNAPEAREPKPAPSLAAEPKEPLLQKPKLFELDKGQAVGGLLGAFALSERLDSHSDLFNLKLGDKNYDVSLMGDAKFDAQYISFRREDKLILARVKDVNELRKKGVIIKIDEKTTYKFKVSINIFSPTRGSTMKIDPVNGTQGPKHRIKTGKILDAIEREAFVFKTSGKAYWLLYGTDVDPETDMLADTRSFLIIHENGLSSKAWPIAEASVVVGTPLEVGLGNTKIVLVKTLGGQLRIHRPAAATAVIDYNLASAR